MNHIQNNFGRYTFESLCSHLKIQRRSSKVSKIKNGNKYITKESLEVEEKTIEILNSNEKI